MAKVSGDGGIIITVDFDNKSMQKGIATIEKEIDKLGNSLKRLGDLMTNAFNVAPLISFGKETTVVVNKLQEIQSAADSAFGNMANKIEEFASSSMLSTWIDEQSNGIAGFMTVIDSLLSGIEAYSAISSFLTPIIDFGTAIGGLLAPISGVVLAIAAAIAIIALMYSTNDQFKASFEGLIGSIGTGLNEVWENNLKPLGASIGTFLAPVMATLGKLWGDLGIIMSSSATAMQGVWEEYLQPTLGFIIDGITSLMDLCTLLWTTTIGPILETIGAGLATLWTETLLPIFDNIWGIITGVIDIIMGLWNNVLAPIVAWLINSFGPPIAAVFNVIWNAIMVVFANIGTVINGLLTSLKGVIDFLAGVFTGDWDRAWKGLVNIFVGIGNSIIGVFELVVNSIIGLVNGLISIVWESVVGVINMITGLIEGGAKLLGFDIDLSISAEPPLIPTMTIPKIPALATGAVVPPNREFLAMLGDNKTETEIVSPLSTMVEAFKQAMSSGNVGGGRPLNVQLVLDSRELGRAVVEVSNEENQRVGTNLIFGV